MIETTSPQNPEQNAVEKPVNRLTRKIKKFFYYFLAIFFVVLAVVIYWQYFFTYSEGYRAGLLQKFSKKGNIFKTYEGEMILSSVQSNKNVALASEKFIFSVTDNKVSAKLDSLQGKDVVVHYREKNRTLPWRGDSPYIVDSVRLSR